MEKHRQISTLFWSDPWVEQLNTVDKCLYIYLFTNAVATLSGVYQLSTRTMSIETGIEKENLIIQLKKFEKENKVKYKDNVMAVKNTIKNQNLNNGFILSGIFNALKTCPKWAIEFLDLNEYIEAVEKFNKDVKNIEKNKFINLSILNISDKQTGVLRSPEDSNINISIDKDIDSNKDSIIEKEFFEKFNEKMPIKIAKLSDKRKKTLKERLKDEFFKDNWKKALDMVPTIPFLMGKNKTDWRADFDFFTRPDSVAKIIEGKYGQGEKPSEYACTEERLEKMLRGEE